jgi:hypothetical protein
MLKSCLSQNAKFQSFMHVARIVQKVAILGFFGLIIFLFFFVIVTIFVVLVAVLTAAAAESHEFIFPFGIGGMFVRLNVSFQLKCFCFFLMSGD